VVAERHFVKQYQKKPDILFPMVPDRIAGFETIFNDLPVSGFLYKMLE